MTPRRALACLVCAIGLFRLVAPAGAAPSACPEHFADGQAPDLLNPKLAVRERELCFAGFGVGHSGQTRTPLWSAEHLTRSAVQAARALPRRGEFHDEPGLPADEEADLGDYRRSGYDRGHMSPSGDMPTLEAQQESFSLANMVPQAPVLNRELWEGVEAAVRSWAVRGGAIYVVTGPVFQGAAIQALNGRVLVPTLIFKAVYDPGWDRAGAYLVRNTDDSGNETISVDQLTALTGIDVFPAISPLVKARDPPSLPRGARPPCRGSRRPAGRAMGGAAARLRPDRAMTLPKPFQDDSASAAVGGLTVENGRDRIAIYGRLDITRDQAGLALARDLARFLDMAIATLAAEPSLPDHVNAPLPAEAVRNPFA